MIPRKLYLVKRGTYCKAKCEGCKAVKRVRYLALYSGRVLCSNCKPHKIGYPRVKKLKLGEENEIKP